MVLFPGQQVQVAIGMQAHRAVAGDGAGHDVQLPARAQGHAAAVDRARLHGLVGRALDVLGDLFAEQAAAHLVEALVVPVGGDIGRQREVARGQQRDMAVAGLDLAAGAQQVALVDAAAVGQHGDVALGPQLGAHRGFSAGPAGGLALLDDQAQCVLARQQAHAQALQAQAPTVGHHLAAVQREQARRGLQRGAATGAQPGAVVAGFGARQRRGGQAQGQQAGGRQGQRALLVGRQGQVAAGSQHQVGAGFQHGGLQQHLATGAQTQVPAGLGEQAAVRGQGAGGAEQQVAHCHPGAGGVERTTALQHGQLARLQVGAAGVQRTGGRCHQAAAGCRGRARQPQLAVGVQRQATGARLQGAGQVHAHALLVRQHEDLAGIQAAGTADLHRRGRPRVTACLGGGGQGGPVHRVGPGQGVDRTAGSVQPHGALQVDAAADQVQ